MKTNRETLCSSGNGVRLAAPAANNAEAATNIAPVAAFSAQAAENSLMPNAACGYRRGAMAAYAASGIWLFNAAWQSSWQLLAFIASAAAISSSANGCGGGAKAASK